MTVELVVGFDLDLTLVDPRPGVRVALEQLGLDPALAESLGPPLEEWLPGGFDCDLYRATYLESAHQTVALPGAAEALEAVRAAGGRTVVVTAKRPELAARCLAAAGLVADALHGSLWGRDKAAALLAENVDVYVGGHPLDLVTARSSGAWGIGVGAGPASPLGADDLIDSLVAFPGALAAYRLVLGLQGLSRVMVAFSGGADSAFLLAAAVRALGADRVLAATAVSASLPSNELAGAQAFAASLGVEHLTPATNEMSVEGYRANAGDRCYFCKAELLDVLTPLAAQRGVEAVLTGTNADDALSGFRPGIRAAHERGALAPLRDVGFTKAQVREVSRRWGLTTWNKPAAACLSSRIAYGIAVTPAGLARVEKAETSLRAALSAAGHPLANVRVRDLGLGVARVEVDLELVDAIASYLDLVEGFDTVTVDERGFRSGSMNELLV